MLEIGSLLICLPYLGLFITSTGFWLLFPPQTRFDCCNSSRNPNTNADSQFYHDLVRRSIFYGDLILICCTWVHGCYQDNAR